MYTPVKHFPKPKLLFSSATLIRETASASSAIIGVEDIIEAWVNQSESAAAKTLAKLVQVDLSSGLTCPVTGLLGDLQVSGGVVVGRLCLSHCAVGVTKGPTGSALSHLHTRESYSC